MLVLVCFAPRNYPSKVNIARKQAEQAEREARGEVLNNKYFGYAILLLSLSGLDHSTYPFVPAFGS